MKLAIYVRVSTSEQKNGISPIDQVERGVELAKSLGCEYEVFQDLGFTGSLGFTGKRFRPSLKNLMQKIESGEVNAVYVRSNDRLSRTLQVMLDILLVFHNKNIQFYNSSGKVDLNDTNQKLLLHLNSVLGQFYLDRTSEDIKRSLHRNAVNGKAGGGHLLAYGYSKDKQKNLIVNEKEAEVIRMIFDLYLQGNGTQRIAQTLHLKKIPTRRNILDEYGKGGFELQGGKKFVMNHQVIWRDKVVLDILKNTIYKGLRKYQGEFYPCPAIVDEGIFDAVQLELKNRNRFKNTTNVYTYMLKGLVQCGRCGRNFYGRKRADLSDNYYGCISHKHKGNFCGTKGVHIPFLDSLVFNSVVNLDKEVEDFYKWYEKEDITKRSIQTAKVLQRDLSTIQTKIDRLVDMRTDNSITKHEFGKQLARLESEREKFQESLRKAQKLTLMLDEKQATISVIRQHLKELKNDSLTDAQKAAYLRIFVDKVVVHWNENEMRHNIEVDFKIDKLTQYRIGAMHEVDYKKYGYRNVRKKVVKEPIRIRKEFLNDNTGTTMSIPMLSVA